MMAPLIELREIVQSRWAIARNSGIPRLALMVGAAPRMELDAVYEPMLNFVLQGGKRITIGTQVLDYDPERYFIISIDVPASGQIKGGPGALPYAALALTLDLPTITDLAADLPANNDHGAPAFSVSPVTPEMTDAWLRMARLMARPHEVTVLAPLIEREILFRALEGPQGWMLRQIANKNSRLSRMRDTIGWLRQHYTEQLKVDDLADRAGMSTSAFHRQFKSTTAHSPLQFQKRLRLLEARQMLTTAAASVTAVSYTVGYESPSQFGREYLRMFGCSPGGEQSRLAKAIG
jgi:AraC-like DNA-binding protein